MGYDNVVIKACSGKYDKGTKLSNFAPGARDRRYMRVVAFGLALMALTPAASAADMMAYKNPKEPLEARVEDLLSRLTLEEKVSLMAGGSSFGTHAIERLGIPALNVSDGPNGVRSNNSEPTTAFPTGSALAATWDTDLIEQVGAAIGEEARAKGIAVMLGPNVNIQRTPLAGRNFEDYSEDPYLAGEIGAGFVRGVQSQGIGTSLKHFVANNQEHERMRSSSDMSERTLREIYLPAFEHVVKEAHPWSVMASYNRVNGTYVSEDRYLLNDILKDEWHYDGLIMSDWGAVHSTVQSASAGLDLEMPGPGNYFGDRLLTAVRDWKVPESVIDDAARRMLRLILRTGVMDGRPLPKGALNTPAHRDLARKAAAEAMVLLKNDGSVLPLDAAKLKSIAVIGPNADAPVIGGGGSAKVVPYRVVTPLEGIKAALGPKVSVTYTPGAVNGPVPPAADARYLSPTRDRTSTGLTANYYQGQNFSGAPVKTETDSTFYKLGFGGDVAARTKGDFSVRWEGYFWPPRTGDYDFTLVATGALTLTIDDKPVITPDTKAEASPILSFLPVKMRHGKVRLEAGHAYPIRLDYAHDAFGFRSLFLGIQPPTGTIADAVAAAGSADAAIVFVGSSDATETEGTDRASMDLYGEQNALVDAVLAANPNTVVVVNAGAPVTMPWAGRAKAVVLEWLAGQEIGDAVADVLFGKTDPSGHLPETFPARYEDNPTSLFYPGTRSAYYGEGIFVGYRYYDSKKIDPMFPFGHGLSYTRFAYGGGNVTKGKNPEIPVDVSVNVKNDGRRTGAAVVQLYIRDVASSEVRPFQELKGFRKIRLEPGENRTLHFALGPRAFSFYDEHRHGWVCEPGEFIARLGESSRDIRQELRFTLDDECRLTAGG